jgi:biopolymer transport protein ExbD|nr:biopolymer transporter ExbD [Kofleriaceae bacterium]
MAIGKLPEERGDDDAESGNDSIFAEINITPLTDVFLVLLIIFMVSALAVQVEAGQQKKQVTQQIEKSEQEKKSGIKINLPAGAAQDIDPSKASLVLEVPTSGDVVVSGHAISEGDLGNLFQHAFQRDKNTQIIIKADAAVSHGRVVGLMELAKSKGLTHLAFGTGGGAAGAP